MTTTKQDIPVLRFKDERGAEYPDWKPRTLGKASRFKNGKPHEADVVENGIYNLITLDSISIEGILKGKHKKVNVNDNSLFKNDIAIVLSDIAHARLLGLSSVIKNDDMYVLNQRMGCIRVDDHHDPRFLSCLINLNQKYFRRRGQGTSQKHIYERDITSLSLKIPCKKEQQKIAAFLSSVDTKIEQLNKKKSLLKQYKKGMMQKLFNLEVRFKDEQGRGYPAWESKRLGELYDITSSKRVFQSEWKDSGIPFHRAREIIELSKNGNVDNGLFISPEMYKEYSEKYGAVQENDLLVTGVGTIGKLYVVPKNSKFYFKDGNIVWFKNMNRVSSIFVKYLFNTRYIEKQLFDNASITTVATYTIEAAKKTKVLIPAIEEQRKIANFLSAIDKKIELVAEQIKQTQTFKKGLLQQMFI